MERVSFAFFVLFLALAAPARADDRAPLFQDHSILKAVLTAPISQAYAQRDQDVRLYFPGEFSFMTGDSEDGAQKLDVSIRVRGNFRRKYCELPPLQLNFRKSQVKGTLFRKQNKLKLVSPCHHGLKSQQKLLLEYYAYRIYEILTERSFGTRLIRLSYVDTDDKKRPWTDLAFVIESEGDLGDRLGLDKARVAYNNFADLEQETTSLYELYQLLIANQDYSVLKGEPGDYCCHNAVLYVSKERVDKRIPIPYDFDMSGFVNADYASPPKHLPIRLVRTRFYRGLCQPPEVLDATIAHIRSKRDEILGLIEKSEVLSPLNRNRALQYLKKYFELIGDPDEVAEKIVGQCRGKEHLDKILGEPDPQVDGP